MAVIVVGPGIVLTFLWIFAISGDIAIWRMSDATGLPLDQFDPLRKLWLMLGHPLHFPSAMLDALREANGLWRQLIGVLGWLNIPLRPFVYAALSAAMLTTWLAPLPYDRYSRARIAVVAGVAAIAYCLAVFLTFYLAYTPVSDPGIWGVQGRYFIVILPLIAAIVGAVVRWNVPRTVIAAAAISGATLSGVACIEAVLRAG